MLFTVVASTAPAPHIDVLPLLKAAWPIWALGAAILAARALSFFWRQHRLRRAGIAEIKLMDGEQFERRLCVLFRDLGYRVEHTGRRGDFGADLVIAKGKKRTVVQAKRWARTVGYDAVKEAHAARSIYDTNGALVVTTSTFSKHARDAAKRLRIDLWAERELVSALLRADGSGERA